MGKVKKPGELNFSFTPIQKIIFDEFAKSPQLYRQFYFTGGTALSVIYLHHRESEDLDFFSEVDFNNEIIQGFIDKVAKLIKIPFRFTQREKVRIYEFILDSKVIIKVDFANYPYKRLKKGLIVGTVIVDDKLDIGINKLQTITSRTQVKDFVDLYFLIKELGFWDLYHGVKEKFGMELDLIWLGADFLKIDQFQNLPKMILPLTLEELREFYKNLAKQIVANSIE